MSGLLAALLTVIIFPERSPQVLPNIPRTTAGLLLLVYLCSFPVGLTNVIMYRCSKLSLDPFFSEPLLAARFATTATLQNFGYGNSLGLSVFVLMMVLLDPMVLHGYLDFISAGVGPLYSHGVAMMVSIGAAIVLLLAYQFLLRTWLYTYFSGSPPSFTFQQFDPSWCRCSLKPLHGSELLLLDVRLVLGNLPSGLLAAICCRCLMRTLTTWRRRMLSPPMGSRRCRISV